jgi:hypothetical protein
MALVTWVLRAVFSAYSIERGKRIFFSHVESDRYSYTFHVITRSFVIFYSIDLSLTKAPRESTSRIVIFFPILISSAWNPPSQMFPLFVLCDSHPFEALISVTDFKPAHGGVLRKRCRYFRLKNWSIERYRFLVVCKIQHTGLHCTYADVY